MKVAIFGVGNMGGAFAAGFLRGKVVDPANLLLIDRDPAKLAEFGDQYGCQVTTEFPMEGIPEESLFILAVKPQSFVKTSSQWSSLVRSKEILSVMAGVTVSSLQSCLPHSERVARCMPNLGVKIGQGMTVLYCPDQVGDGFSARMMKLLAPLGETLSVKNENLLQAATAVSGSGPGFVYLLMESFIAAAEKVGFSPAESLQLVTKTFQGALALQNEVQLAPDQLRSAVTSTGGTTAAGIEIFDQHNVKHIVQEAVDAAYKRAIELSQKD